MRSYNDAIKPPTDRIRRIEISLSAFKIRRFTCCEQSALGGTLIWVATRLFAAFAKAAAFCPAACRSPLLISLRNAYCALFVLPTALLKLRSFTRSLEATNAAKNSSQSTIYRLQKNISRTTTIFIVTRTLQQHNRSPILRSSLYRRTRLRPPFCFLTAASFFFLPLAGCLPPRSPFFWPSVFFIVVFCIAFVSLVTFFRMLLRFFMV